MNFSIKYFFSECGHVDLVTFTEETLNRKLHFLCSEWEGVGWNRGTKISIVYNFPRNEIGQTGKEIGKISDIPRITSS